MCTKELSDNMHITREKKCLFVRKKDEKENRKF